MRESRLRSVVKTLSYRAVGLVITGAIAYVVTRDFDIAALVGAFDTVVKTGAYYLHERAWGHVRFGRLKAPEYEI